jgi:hypothetical protein
MFQAITRQLGSWLALPLFVVALAGCQSGGMSSYVSPRVTGRVIAADTHQPLEGVRVRRGAADQDRSKYSNSLDPKKGAEMMETPGAVRTEKDGTFVLASESTLSPFNHAGWYSVTINFQLFGYEMFETNYTIANITGHTSEGAPIVNAGDIVLQPVAR